MFPALLAHAIGVRLRIVGGTGDTNVLDVVGPENGRLITVFHNGLDHYEGSSARAESEFGQSRAPSELSELTESEASTSESEAKTGPPLSKRPRGKQTGGLGPEVKRQRLEPAATETSTTSVRPERGAPMTAEKLLHMLRWRAQHGGAARATAARFEKPDANSSHLGRIADWLRSSGWARKKLAHTLAGMPDYPTYRDEIQQLVNQQGVHEGQLPAPRAVPRTYTAEDFVQVLESLAAARREGRRGGQSSSALAERTGISASQIRLWIDKDGVPKIGVEVLSRMPGFAQHRERMVTALERLGQRDMARRLPGPNEGAPRRQPITARVVAEALQRLAADPKTPPARLASDLGVPQSSLLGHIARGAQGLVKPESLVTMPDYEQWRDSIADSLMTMGHPHQADSLPQPGDLEARDPVTAAILAQALTQLANDPTTHLSTIAADAGISTHALSRYLSGSQGLTRPHALLRLSDYTQWRESIADSLRRMGLSEQADFLPQPTGAVEFLDTLRSHAPQVAVAIQQMRSNPALSAHEAARRAGAPERAFAIAVTAGPVGPTIRDQSTVEAELHGLRPHLQAGITTVLHGLNSLASGRDSGAADLIEARIRGGGFTPDRLYLVEHEPLAGRTRSQLGDIYSQNPALVRSPRPYVNDRAAQVLRWLSTELLGQHAQWGEVQAYFDRDSQTIHVSSNVNRVNREMRQNLNNSGLQLSGGERQGADGREARHRRKLAHALAHLSNHDDPLAHEILQAIAAGRFSVPPQSFHEGDRRALELHAERRIHEALGGHIDLDLLAGTMRACGHCAAALGFEDHRTRGPFWLTNGASAYLDSAAIIQRNRRHRVASYVTKTRDGRTTTEYNTDSDSEPEDGNPSRREPDEDSDA